MRLLHTGDLHIGKKMGARPLLADQEHILGQILEVIREYQVSALLISGDVYDRSVPPEDAVKLVDTFLADLAAAHVAVCIIPGNHDSADRLSFAKTFLEHAHIYIAGPYDGTVDAVQLADDVIVYLLPHLKIQPVKLQYPDLNISTLDDAVRAVVDDIQLDAGKTNIIMAHQFVVNGAEKPEISESETHFAGNIEEISASIFSRFDYTALGHLHKPQSIGLPAIRYSGSPLKYSASETGHVKSVSLIDTDTHTVTEIPLKPLHDVRRVRATLDTLADTEGSHEDYVYVVLTDDVPDMKTQEKVEQVFPNFLEIRREIIAGTRAERALSSSDLKTRDPETIFADFYQMQFGEPLSSYQQETVRRIFTELSEGDGQP